MRGIWTNTDVSDEIYRRNHVQPRVDHAGVEELIIPGVDTAGFDRFEYRIPEIRRLRIIKNFLEQPLLTRYGQRAKAIIVLGPASTPGCPAPDMSVSAEIVA